MVGVSYGRQVRASSGIPTEKARRRGLGAASDFAIALTQGPSVLAAWEVWVTLEGGVARPEPNTEAPVADKKTQTETTQGTAEAGQGGQKPNKMEAMRRVLAKLGDAAPTLQIQSELRESFGIDMTTKHISTYRADIIKKRKQKSKKPAAKKPEPAKQEPAPRHEPPVQPVAGGN